MCFQRYKRVYTRAIDPRATAPTSVSPLSTYVVSVVRCHSLPSCPQVAMYFSVARKRGAANATEHLFNIAANVCLPDEFPGHAR